MINKWFIFGFVAGAATGAVAAYFSLTKKFEDRLVETLEREREAAERHEKEKESRKDSTSSKDEDAANQEKPSVGQKIAKDKPDLDEYVKTIKKTGYSKVEKPKKAPYEISFDEFEHDAEDYEKMSLTYYADGILADERDIEIEEPIAGRLDNKFEEDDTVYIRNDERREDYEITYDDRTYEEVSGNKPHQAEE